MVLDGRHIARLPDVFPPEELCCPPAEVIAVEAREQRGHFSIIHHETGFKADLYLSGRDPLHAGDWHGRADAKWRARFWSSRLPKYVILRKLGYYREGGSEKHLRDIRSLLDTSPKAINIADVEQEIAARCLQEAWRQVQKLGE